jgi:hypothetical protein
VTIWALPVKASVAVITGHEKDRKPSKVLNRWPQDRSYLFIESQSIKAYEYFHLPGYSIELKISHIPGVHLSTAV